MKDQSAFSEACVVLNRSDGRTLVGIVSHPLAPPTVAVVVVVGGPQYRVGSHRQFVQLARAVRCAGFGCLRFDAAGMGDSAGDIPNFENLDDDIGAAIDAAFVTWPSLGKVVLWGLCDGASAALMYWQRRRDPRVGGMCLANPWLRSSGSLERTYSKHYYRQRLRQREFWLKLARGAVSHKAITAFAGNLLQTISYSWRRQDPLATPDYCALMAWGWHSFARPILLCISGNDLTAREFLDGAMTQPAWRGALDSSFVHRLDLPTADHTFSARSDRLSLEAGVIGWLRDRFLPAHDLNLSRAA